MQEQSPFETFIQLGRDPLERHATLLTMKRQKLKNARDFLRARMQFLDPTAEFCEHQKFVNQHGDLCYMSFDITPLRGRSVKSVFDVLLNFAYTFEMSISEVLGDITIRENDDSWDPSVSQHRLVTLVANRAQMETNHVMFSEYYPRGPAFPGESDCPPLATYDASGDDRSELGILATDFVNEDELFPYHTSERLRQDVTVLSMVISHPAPPGTDGMDGGEGERIVVLCRWALIRVRRSDIPLSSDLRRRLHEGMQKVDEAMINNVRSSIGPRAPNAIAILHPPSAHTVCSSTTMFR